MINLDKSMNIAIILASGLGKRMGAGKNKVLLSVGKKPVIFYALRMFQNSPNIDEIIVVSRPEEIRSFRDIVKKYNFAKVSDIISGGKERQDSAFNALQHLRGKIVRGKKTVVIFHNGANPFVTREEIDRSILETKKYGACVVAHPTKDTIKEVDRKGLVAKTLERKKLWSMQTPQSIRFDLAWQAFSKASQDNFLGTDDVSLVERLGKKVKVIEGSLYNFKITTPLDLELAKIILCNYEF